MLTYKYMIRNLNKLRDTFTVLTVVLTKSETLGHVYYDLSM